MKMPLSWSGIKLMSPVWWRKSWSGSSWKSWNPETVTWPLHFGDLFGDDFLLDVDAEWFFECWWWWWWELEWIWLCWKASLISINCSCWKMEMFRYCPIFFGIKTITFLLRSHVTNHFTFHLVWQRVMICGRNRLGKKFENYWVVCLYFEFWKELSFFDLEIFCKIGVFCNKMSISLRQILGSEPWATLAQLSLIFGLSFAFAGRVVKRHGRLTAVEAPAAGRGMGSCSFPNPPFWFRLFCVGKMMLKLTQPWWQPKM